MWMFISLCNIHYSPLNATWTHDNYRSGSVLRQVNSNYERYIPSYLTTSAVLILQVQQKIIARGGRQKYIPMQELLLKVGGRLYAEECENSWDSK